MTPATIINQLCIVARYSGQLRMPKTRWATVFSGLLLGVLLFLTASAGAEEGFTFKTFKKDLPSVSVITVAQSRDGYLWLGTVSGLARFDGLHFTSFDESETPGLSSGPVSFLFGDSHGNLWVGTDEAGTKVIKGGRVHNLDIGTPTREGRLVAAAEAPNGDVWLATANGQLCRYRGSDMEVWGPIPLFNGCSGMALEKNGALWISTAFSIFNLDSKAIESGKELPKIQGGVVGRVDFLLASTQGGVWLKVSTNIVKYRDDQVTGPTRTFPWQILSAVEDPEGNLIVGTRDHGVSWFHKDGKVETITSLDGLSHDTALALRLDREGALWIGTDGGGLNRVKRRAFELVPQLAATAIQSVWAAGTNRLWVTAEGAMRLSDGNLERYDVPDGVNCSAVLVDRKNQVWVGSRDYGLFQVKSNRLEHVPERRMAARALTITALHEDRAGGLWVGTKRGLAHRKQDNWEYFTPTNNPAIQLVSAIADDTNGNVWIGTANGLSRWRDGVITSYTEKDGLPSADISSVLVDSSGRVWAGTRGRGLSRLVNDKWVPLAEAEGLPAKRVHYLAEDAQQGLWIGTSSGLVHIEKESLDEFISGKTKTVRSRLFDEADGFPGECSGGSKPATARSADGTMWFATTLGLASLNPARLVRNTNPPPVMIESVTVSDVSQNTNSLLPNFPQRIIVPAGREQPVEIRYTSLNLAAPERARFKYQLENHEEAWTDAKTDRSVRYAKLPPGNYIFHVKACNEDGVWNEIGASLAIEVEPPFWRTWWFLTLAVLVLLGSIVATVHLISTQKLQRQLAGMRQQEALERERARIARDLHDQLGANLTQISLLSELAESDKEQPEEVEAHAKQITVTARTTAAALDEIVWAANPSNDTLDSLVTYACKYAQEYFALADLSYRIDAPKDLPPTPVPPDVRHNVFLAFKESVNNVVKHAQATAAKVRVQYDAERFTLEIEDNGRGVPANALDKGRNGLRNMRKRMEDVGGEFALGPAPEHGTLVRLTAPLAKKAPMPGKH